MTAPIAIRPVTETDIDHLWEMLFHASHSDAVPGASVDDCREDPDLARYVDGWGRPGDLGVVALDGDTVIGAAWVRLPVPGDERLASFVHADVPELAVAVLPGLTGAGTGRRMLESLLESAHGRYPAITLNARSDNPAVRLYERLGFRVVETIVNRVGGASVKMLLDLAGRDTGSSSPFAP